MSPVSESSGDQAASGSGQRRESESARPAGLSGPQRAQHTPRSNTDTRSAAVCRAPSLKAINTLCVLMAYLKLAVEVLQAHSCLFSHAADLIAWIDQLHALHMLPLHVVHDSSL